MTMRQSIYEYQFQSVLCTQAQQIDTFLKGHYSLNHFDSNGYARGGFVLDWMRAFMNAFRSSFGKFSISALLTVLIVLIL